MADLGKILILGDSYSTFEGWIPEGYECYYTKNAKREACPKTVEQTWWHQLICETGSELFFNSSYSGTTISNTGYNGEDCSHKSFIARFDELCKNGAFSDKKPDTMIIFGGTNDSWAGSPIGELKYENWTKEDLFSTLPAFGYLLTRVKEVLPETRVICVLNRELKPEIWDGLKEACEKFKVSTVELDPLNIEEGHPTITGMKEIKDTIKKYL